MDEKKLFQAGISSQHGSPRKVVGSGKQNVPLGCSVQKKNFFLVYWINEPNATE